MKIFKDAYGCVFASAISLWFWLLVRIYVGWEWVEAGWQKFISTEWNGFHSGSQLADFLQGSLAKTAGDHPDVQWWYADFLRGVVLPHVNIWSHVIAYGELAVGVALIIGAFTCIAAFFGSFMNFNYLLSGTVSINPVLLILSIGIMLAWRVCGSIGVDRYLMPALKRRS